jgi:hypothetical protein
MSLFRASGGQVVQLQDGGGPGTAVPSTAPQMGRLGVAQPERGL